MKKVIKFLTILLLFIILGLSNVTLVGEDDTYRILVKNDLKYDIEFRFTYKEKEQHKFTSTPIRIARAGLNYIVLDKTKDPFLCEFKILDQESVEKNINFFILLKNKKINLTKFSNLRIYESNSQPSYYKLTDDVSVLKFVYVPPTECLSVAKLLPSINDKLRKNFLSCLVESLEG